MTIVIWYYLFSISSLALILAILAEAILIIFLTALLTLNLAYLKILVILFWINFLVLLVNTCLLKNLISLSLYFLTVFLTLLTNFLIDFLTTFLKATHLILLMNVLLNVNLLHLYTLPPHPHLVPAHPPTINHLTHLTHFLWAIFKYFLVTFLIKYLVLLSTFLIATYLFTISSLALIFLI